MEPRSAGVSEWTGAFIDAWERGQSESAGARAVTLLAACDRSARRSDLEALPVGVRDRHLLELRKQLFGSAVEAVASCPGCAERVELHFEVDDVIVPGAQPAVDRVEVETPTGPLVVRLPTAGDLAAIPDGAEAERALTLLLDRVVSPPTGDASPAPTELTPETVERIGAALAEADEQADITFDVTCPQCGASFRAPFDVVAFLWSELSDWAARLLGDVHTLALAYGWREDDTLALSPARRRFYLEAVRA